MTTRAIRRTRRAMMSKAAQFFPRVCLRPIDDGLVVIRPSCVAALALFMSITLPGGARGGNDGKAAGGDGLTFTDRRSC